MKLKKVLILLCLIFITNSLVANFQSIMIKTALDFITKPNDFFIEINTDIENTGTTFASQKFQVGTSLLWDILSVVNFQSKYKIFDEKEHIPEIIPGISGWYIYGLLFLPKDDLSGSAYGFTPSLTLGKKIEKNVKFFSGIKYSVGSINLKIKNLSDVKISDSFKLDLTSISDITSIYKEFGLYTGINYLQLSEKEVAMLIGYYPGLKKIYSKIQISSSTFDYGLSLYPDSYLLLHLYLNLHINL